MERWNVKHQQRLISAVVLSALSSLGLATLPAWADEAAPAAPPAAQDSSQMEDIVVTGTRRVDRTLTDSASPIDVISGGDLAAQPTGSLLDAMSNLVPSFFVPQNTISDASTFVRAPSLRGLPSDEVMVMLNGKRFNRSALVQVYNGGDTGLSFGSQGSDISSIPAIAVKKLEVLREGATAQYGSDAIAGVLNYGLRDDAGLEVDARYGQYQDHGDGKSKQLAIDWGTHFGNKGFVNIAGEYDNDGQTSRGATRPLAVAFAAANPSLANELPNYPLPAQIWGDSPSHGVKATVNAAMDVTDAAKVYLVGNYGKHHADESFNFRSSQVTPIPFTDTNGVVHNLSGNGAFKNPYYLTQCPAGNPTCPAGGYVQDSNVFNLSSLYPAGFTPRFVGDTEEVFVTAGVKGHTDFQLRYDLSAATSRNSLDLSMYQSISPSYGPASQTTFKFGNLIQKEDDANLDLSYDIEAGLASPLTISGGLETRKETYEATAGDPQSYGAGPYAAQNPLFTQISPGVYQPTGTQTAAESPGASGYGGTSPTYAGSHSQNSYGVYLDLEADLTKTFSAGVATRLEHYGSFGSDTVYKLNGLWKASNLVSLRGTIGTGFHAPSPGQDNAEVLTTNFIAGQQVQTGTYPVTSPIAQYYGARALKPEKSTNYGLGIVLSPSDKATVTLDAYSIKVKDRIYISGTYNVAATDIAALPALAGVGVGGVVQYFTNAFDTTNKGIDLVGTLRGDLAGGNLNLTLAYNYNTISVDRYDPTIINQAQIITAEHLAPNHRVNLQGMWSYGSLVLGAIEHYYGTWRSEIDYPGQVFGAKFTTDVYGSYTFLKNFDGTLGVNNLFNVYPDKIAPTAANPIFPITGSTSDGQVYPRSGGPFGMNGAFLYARLQYKF